VLILFSLTLFLSAFLLFVVQPMEAKAVLPVLGGAPAVWNTCMVFFQAVLLAGYGYAHFASSRLGVRRHVPIHLALLTLILVPAPLSGRLPAPPASDQPMLWLLGVLAVSVGPAAFALATTAPLLQRWLAESRHAERGDPYFLYGASNLGSMAALLGYPFVIEPHVSLAAQRGLWRIGFVALALLIGACGFVWWRRGAGSPPAIPATAATGEPPTRHRMIRWIVLALVPSSLMLGLTTYITTDIAPIPLFWVVPLALYLVTYVIAFSRPHPVVQRVAIALLPVAILGLIAVHVAGTRLTMGVRIAAHLAAFFDAALVCHGELAASRPGASHLTRFYLALSTGGVLGGALNALVAPVIFPCVVEYPLVIALVALLKPGAAGRLGRAWTVLGVAAGVIFLAQAFGRSAGITLAMRRDFFGPIRVRTDATREIVGLQHGTTVHGIQRRDPAWRGEPLGYYSRPGPIGQVFAVWDSTRAGDPVGVVGLGAGTLACYARPGQVMTFYEIDPAIERVARDTSMFTYVGDALARGARVSVVLGDARLRLAGSTQHYALLVLDAFSSDAIPVHLLTREALRVYLDHLEPGGLLAVHFSSRYVALDPELAALAHGAGLECRIEDDPGAAAVERDLERVPSRWVVMARDETALGGLASDPRWKLPVRVAAREWTDDFSSLATLIQWGARPPAE